MECGCGDPAGNDNFPGNRELMEKEPMPNQWRKIVWIMWLAALSCSAAWAQKPTASGTINATLINWNGISLVFDSDPSGVTLGANGSSNASLNFQTISASGTLSPGVTRTASTSSSFTVTTYFDVKVIEGGLNSTGYTLTANLASAAPQGLTYQVDSVALTTGSQSISTNGTYNTDVKHALNLQVSTASPTTTGPAINTPLTATINFVATAN